MKKLILVILSIVTNFSLLAQEVKLFKNFGIDNSMSYNFVRTIAQDEEGFMWFGSSEGLDRFDGHQSLSFHHDNTKPNSLSSNIISRILIDKKQRLWVGTFGGGLNLYRPMSQDFSHFTTKTKKAALTNDIINALFEDSEGKIWIATENGLNILSSENKEWSTKHIVQELGNPNSLTHNVVLSIIETANNEIWIGTNGGIARYDGYHFDIFYDDFKDLTELNQHYAKTLWNAPDNKIWIGRIEEGLSVFDPATKKFTQYLHNKNDSSSLSDNNVWSIIGDQQGNIYIGTDNGLDHVNNKTGIISHIAILGCTSVFKENKIRSLLLDRDNYLWIGTTHGLCKVQLSENGSYKNQLIGQNIVSFNGQDIRTIYESYGGAIWVGTQRNGAAWFLPNSVNVSRITYNPKNIQSLSDNWVNSIIQPTSDRIWLGTANGIDVINSKNGEVIRHIKNDPTIKSSITSDYIRTLLLDDSGIVWIGTWGKGLNYFNPSNTAVSRLHHSPYQKKSLTKNYLLMFQKQQMY